ncbi:cupin domain-containing protein [Rhodoplanes sp.]|uniref:cupin domain-containing protein n=1 Tax=Rhodoplanes sp. TaxID=1968906 RepID=UPI0025FF15BE|nr:cupin domain-containing protein [Rhodoplanes sp.]
MSDIHGLKRAAERGVTLRQIGNRIVLENDHVRVWEVKLEPGQTIDFHIHYHPYAVISLGGGENEVETIFGDKRDTYEPTGHTVFIDGMRPVHKLTNKSKVTYLARLVELKHITWTPEEAPLPSAEAPKTEAAKAEPAGGGAAAMPADAMSAFKEILIQTADLEWAAKSLAGLSQKMLWRNEETGASIGLVKFEQGSGVPEAHAHASNQFMFCLSGKYRYIPTGTTLTPGCFYWNPKGSVHGPTIAEETSILLEIYDGPHYPVRPTWYTDDADAH